MIRSSLKQLFRRPVRALLFLILMAVVVLFLTVGISLYNSTNENMREIEGIFQTVGFIDQKAVGVHENRYWDGLTETYSYESQPEYGAPLSLEAFDFPEANYILPPQNRPFYYADSEAYPHGYGRAINTDVLPIVEYRIEQRYEDILPVRARVTRVLNGTYEQGQEIWICQHYTEDPLPLEVGKTYVSSLQVDYVDGPEDAHGMQQYTDKIPVVPYLPLGSGQMDARGEGMDDPLYTGYSGLCEVTEGFYETETGRRVQLLAQQGSTHMYRAHILSTDGLQLLRIFYEKEVYYTDGRAITQEEFDSGAKVCMLESTHAGFNDLTVGDMVDFSFMSAVYGGSPSLLYSKSIYNPDPSTMFGADGAVYEPFFEGEYEVVGLFEPMGSQDFPDNPYNPGYGTVIVPSKSIGGSDAENRNGNLILKGYNTSFQIPNGTTGAYQSKLGELGLSDQAEITFYDGGYENIKAGLLRLRDMAAVLMLSGGVSAVAARAEAVSREEGFDTRYSNWILAQESAVEALPEAGAEKTADIAIPIAVVSGVVCFSLLVSSVFAAVNLKKEPMELLGSREN